MEEWSSLWALTSEGMQGSRSTVPYTTLFLGLCKLNIYIATLVRVHDCYCLCNTETALDTVDETSLLFLTSLPLSPCSLSVLWTSSVHNTLFREQKQQTNEDTQLHKQHLTLMVYNQLFYKTEWRWCRTHGCDIRGKLCCVFVYCRNAAHSS